jgi:Mlc titration factor MtfA (ptsG expression regulator)
MTRRQLRRPLRGGNDEPVYVINDNDFDVRRCNGSRDDQILITITGVSLDGHIKAFAGIVQSVEHNLDRDQGRRWRVTIL